MNCLKADSQQVFLGLGANIGNLESNIRQSLALLNLSKAAVVIKVSSLQETKPVGVVNQPSFLNGAAEIETTLSPLNLLKLLKEIEKQVGRQVRERWGPREIDLDILYYGSDIIKEAELIIPHPELEKRKFVLLPLVEIAPDFCHPVWQLTNSELLAKLEKYEV